MFQMRIGRNVCKSSTTTDFWFLTPTSTTCRSQSTPFGCHQIVTATQKLTEKSQMKKYATSNETFVRGRVVYIVRCRISGFFDPLPPLVRRAYYISDVTFMKCCTQKQNPSPSLQCMYYVHGGPSLMLLPPSKKVFCI